MRARGRGQLRLVIQDMIDTMVTEPDAKFVLFSQFAQTLLVAGEALMVRGVPHATLATSASRLERQVRERRQYTTRGAS